MFKLLYVWLFTGKPQKKIAVEVQLMLLTHKKKIKILRKFFQRRIYYKYHCEISHLADIEDSVSFVHPIGVIIGSKATVKANSIIYQGVTIGSTSPDNLMPSIGRNVKIYAGAKVLGGITIGDNSIIGANSVVTKSVPAASKVVGVNRLI